MVLILTILLIVFFVFQIFIISLNKRNISNKQLNIFLGLTIFDFLTTGLAIYAVNFKFNSKLLAVVCLLLIVNYVIFYFFYNSLILKKLKIKHYVFGSLIILLSAFILIFNKTVGDLGYIIIFSIVICLLLISFSYRRIYTSNYLKKLIIIFCCNELTRLALIYFVIYQLLFSNIIIYFILFIFVIKTFSLNVLNQIYEVEFIDKNLAKVLDYISPSRLLSITYTEHPDAIVLTDNEKKILFANPQTLENTGYKIEEIIGKTPRIFAIGKTSGEVYDDMNRSIKEDKG